MNKAGIVLIFLGAAIAVFSHPRVGRPIVTRLENEGLVTPQRVKSENAEIIKFAGPHLSLLLLGVVLIIIGLIIL